MTSPSLASVSRVNTYVSGNQRHPAMAADALGNAVIVWDSALQDGSGDGVYGRRYTTSGNPTGGEFRVNTTTTGDQNNPAVAASTGSFVVVWTSNTQDGSGRGIYAQRYNASGAPLGAEFRANQVTEDEQTNPDVAMDASGNFVVVFESRGLSPNTIGQDASETGIFAQRFNSAGAPVGLQFRVNSITENAQTAPTIAMNNRGQFVVVWTSAGQDGDGLGVFAQRYDALGNPVGIELQVNTQTTGDQLHPSVAMDNAGNFVVAWQSERGSSDIYAQRFSAAGSPLGDEFRVNIATGGDQTTPAVDMDANGNFTVVWADENEIRGRRFTRDGRSGSEFAVSSSSSSDEESPTALAVTATGDFSVAWQAGSSDNQDVFIRGTTGGKTIQGTSGPDDLQGTENNDQMSGLAGSDLLRGLKGNDVLKGNAGNDTLAGQEGDDVLQGASNADTLDGGAGDDTLTGGSGNDLFILQPKQGSTTITDFEEGTDQLGLGQEFAPSKLRFEQSGSDTIVIWNGIEIATLSNVTASQISYSDDFVVASSIGQIINGDRNNNRLSGTSGSDTISGFQGNDILSGRNGDDTLIGASGADVLTGDNGFDTLLGGSGNDRLNGGQGDDFVDAGAGNDTVTGGSGIDTFFLTLKKGTTIITDFQDGTDFLALSEELDPGQIRTEQRGADAAVLLNGNLLALLKNARADSITNTVSDFI
ncbi:MAG: hypothetical protein IGS38_14265 [Synechococcales cyanobacterium M58_A2018_015]|nr:hypothetical protein [Synechococcales cyanobacterium M58_A2018_015]